MEEYNWIVDVRLYSWWTYKTSQNELHYMCDYDIYDNDEVYYYDDVFD